METLTLKDISPYLPYGLKMQFESKGGRIITLTGITKQSNGSTSITNGHGGMWLESCGFKPLLRPLSSLTLVDFKYYIGKEICDAYLDWFDCVRTDNKT